MDFIIGSEEAEKILQETKDKHGTVFQSYCVAGKSCGNIDLECHCCGHELPVEDILFMQTQLLEPLAPISDPGSTEDKSDQDQLLQNRVSMCNEAVNILESWERGACSISSTGECSRELTGKIPIPVSSEIASGQLKRKRESERSLIVNLPPQVTGFTKFGGAENRRSFRSSPRGNYDCAGKALGVVHPVCCGPSKIKFIFDGKIEKLEQQIIKFCYQIKDQNILLAQCCRSKDLLFGQKCTLHNILLRVCEKTKELEGKLYSYRMAICCPKMPPTCYVGVNCRDEIKQIRRIEDKLETVINGCKHKTALKEICLQSKNTVNEDIKAWDADINAINEVKKNLDNILNGMKSKVCGPRKENEGVSKPEPPPEVLSDEIESSEPRLDEPRTLEEESAEDMSYVNHRRGSRKRGGNELQHHYQLQKHSGCESHGSHHHHCSRHCKIAKNVTKHNSP